MLFILNIELLNLWTRRFALSFGLDAVKNREAVTQLHREGILVAVTPVS